jgi:Na+-driven multidrug efflux pump
MITEPSNDALAAQEQAQVDAAVQAIVSRGPSGALAVAGVAVALVLAMWVAFYVFVFLPRT